MTFPNFYRENMANMKLTEKINFHCPVHMLYASVLLGSF
uniref:Uncharacterized protein n=1 Tax=Anguilla anguilla TaxID=7936 RepID=A0A0E9U158_ANGAN